jgi:uncharacterized protein YndB with AHSA1/START domain
MDRPGEGPQRVSHTFRVPPDRVFDAWVEPSVARQWLFATTDGAIVRCEIDARVGGAFSIVDRRGGEDVEHLGRYLVVQRPGRLVFDFGVPKYSSATSTVAITIAASAEGCHLTLEHAGVPAEFVESTVRGWDDLLGRLAALLEAGAAA